MTRDLDHDWVVAGSGSGSGFGGSVSALGPPSHQSLGQLDGRQDRLPLKLERLDRR